MAVQGPLTTAPIQAPSNQKSILTKIKDTVGREWYYFAAFCRDDYTAAVIPGVMFSFGAVRSTSLLAKEIVGNYGYLAFWLMGYVYSHTLLNQLMGVEEDRVNKPHRPLPSGELTIHDAQIRYYIAVAAWIGLALFKPDLLPETVAWVVTALFLNLFPWCQHWFPKNYIAMSSGTWTLFSGAWKAIAPSTPVSHRYSIAISIWVGLAVSMQDLRDVEGDRVRDRKTLPVIYGDRVSRVWMTLSLIVSLGALYWGGIYQLNPPVILAYHALLGYRVMKPDLANIIKSDQMTYWYLTYLFCILGMLCSLVGV